MKPCSNPHILCSRHVSPSGTPLLQRLLCRAQRGRLAAKLARDGARHSSLPVLMLDGYWSCWGRAFAKARLQSLDAILARALLAPKRARAIQARAARRAQRERIQFLN